MFNKNAGKIIICSHCGDKCSGEYCVKCNTLEKRIKVDKENAENFAKHGMKYESPCKKCKAELAEIERKKKK